MYEIKSINYLKEVKKYVGIVISPVKPCYSITRGFTKSSIGTYIIVFKV